MTIVGERPRPWVLVVGVADDDLTKALESAVKTVDYVDEFRPSLTVRLTDYDALFLLRPVAAEDLLCDLNIIEFSASPSSETFEMLDDEGGVQYKYKIDTRAEGVAKLLVVPDALPDSMRKLATASLAPWLLENSPRGLLEAFRVNPQGFTIRVGGAPVGPIVNERDGLPCAALWQRPTGPKGHETQHWWFPAEAPAKGDWFKAALEVWERRYPERFPVEGRADWRQSAKWQTRAEVAAAETADKARLALEQKVSELQQTQEETIAELDQLRTDADARERLLLTAQGDALKDQTALALQDLGFTVVDSDEEKEAQGAALLEDLKVSDAEGAWTAIVEVRGYARGAKTSDFPRLARAARGYERQYGREPDARWYIVNHHLNDAPDDRPRVLQGADSDVEEFATDRGLVVDTRELFRLREQVLEGLVDLVQLREHLMSARGLFDLGVAIGTDDDSRR